MVYILGVLTISMATTGHSYSLLASLCSVFIFNYFFTYPYFTLMSDPSYIATFAVMLTVALLGSFLPPVSNGRPSRAPKRHTALRSCWRPARSSRRRRGGEILAVTATQLKKLLERDVLIYSADEDGLEQEAMLFPVSKGGGYVCISHFLRAGGGGVGSGTTTSTPALPPTPFPALNASTLRSAALTRCWRWLALPSPMLRRWTPLKKI